MNRLRQIAVAVLALFIVGFGSAYLFAQERGGNANLDKRLDAATATGVTDSLPPLGSILPYVGTAESLKGQVHWQICDGSPLSEKADDQVRDMLGGAEAKVPNLRDRLVVGVGENTTLNNVGTDQHKHTAAHRHTINPHKHVVPVNSKTGGASFIEKSKIKDVDNNKDHKDQKARGMTEGDGNGRFVFGITEDTADVRWAGHTHTFKGTFTSNENKGGSRSETNEITSDEADFARSHVGLNYIIRIR